MSSEVEEQPATAPLIPEFPDCSGCKAAYLKRKDAGVPYKLLFYLGIVVLANCLPISIIYPFVYFMVKDFHVAKSDEDIGYYAGWIGSSFMAGRVLTGLLWGRMADRYGRKPPMYLGVISVLVFNTLFGLSTSFEMAVITRFILGAFNGVLGVVKAYVSEICNEEHQAIGISMVGTVWGLGLIIGPAMGGFLSQPAEKFPNVFTEGSLFARFPYLLQALCASAFALFALFALPGLPETLHSNHHKQEDVEGSSEKAVEAELSIWRNWPLMASTVVYCLWSLHEIAYTETFSLWSVSPRSYGGLSFTTSDVGLVLGVSGFAILLAQLFLFPSIAKIIGPIGGCRYGAFLTVPLLVVYPYFSKIHEKRWAQIAVYAAAILKSIFTVAVMTSSFMLINNTTRQRQRAAANGFSVSIGSVFKAIGPAVGGIVFACAQKRQDTWFVPGDHLVFFFLNIFAFLTFLTTFEPFLPQSANKLVEEVPGGNY